MNQEMHNISQAGKNIVSQGNIIFFDPDLILVVLAATLGFFFCLYIAKRIFDYHVKDKDIAIAQLHKDEAEAMRDMTRIQTERVMDALKLPYDLIDKLVEKIMAMEGEKRDGR